MKKPYDIECLHSFRNDNGAVIHGPFTRCAVELLRKHGIDGDKFLDDLHNGINPGSICYSNVKGYSNRFEFHRNGKYLFTMEMEEGPVVITADGASSTFRFREVEDGNA